MRNIKKGEDALVPSGNPRDSPSFNGSSVGTSLPTPLHYPAFPGTMINSRDVNLVIVCDRKSSTHTLPLLLKQHQKHQSKLHKTPTTDYHSLTATIQSQSWQQLTLSLSSRCYSHCTMAWTPWTSLALSKS